MSHSIEFGTEFISGGGDQAVVDAIKATGARWVRIPVDFAFIYDPQSDYTGDTPDYAGGADGAFMLLCKAAGLKVLAQLCFVPPWLYLGTAGYPQSPPSDFDVWAEMCRRAYRDLYAVVDAWEVWNEPNHLQFWRDEGSSTWRYPLLLRKTVNAIRGEAVTQGQTWATPVIISGGLSTDKSGSQNWTDRWDRGSDPLAADHPGTVSMGTALDKLFDASNGIVPGTTVNTPYVNGYGVHTYAWGLGKDGVLNHYFESPMVHCFERVIPVGSTPFAFWQDIICAHESYSDPLNPGAGAKKLWATECGFPATAGSYTTNGTEADAATAMNTAWTYWEFWGGAGAGPMFHFPYKDYTGDQIAAWGGLVRGDDTAKIIRSTFAAHASQYAPPSTPTGVKTYSDPTVDYSDPGVTYAGGVIGTSEPPVVPPTTPGTIPVVKLEFGIHPRPDSGHYIVWGDPARGFGSGYTLAPEYAWYDITEFAQDWSLSQGRNEELGQAQPGELSATLYNNDRRFDNNNWSGPYFPYVRTPRPGLRISVDGIPWITTKVDKLSPSYFDFNQAKVDIGGHDALSLLARTQVKFHARQQSTERRVNRILDHVAHSGHRDIHPGSFTMGTFDVDGQALDEINRCAEAEGVLVWAGPDGTIIFTDRSYLTATPGFTFADDGTGDADYLSLEYRSGEDFFWNQTAVRRRALNDDDKPQWQEYTDWQSVTAQGGVVRREFDESPVATDGWAALQAAMLGPEYTVPIDRISSVTLCLSDFPQGKRVAFGLLAPGTVVNVKHHPVGGGSPSVVTQKSLIIGRALSGTNGQPGTWNATWFFKAI